MDFGATELVGHAASVFLVVSFAMKDIKKLRLINSVSCLLFVAYGFMLTTAWPIIIANLFVLSANIWHLLKKPVAN